MQNKLLFPICRWSLFSRHNFSRAGKDFHVLEQANSFFERFCDLSVLYTMTNDNESSWNSCKLPWEHVPWSRFCQLWETADSSHREPYHVERSTALAISRNFSSFSRSKISGEMALIWPIQNSWSWKFAMIFIKILFSLGAYWNNIHQYTKFPSPYAEKWPDLINIFHCILETVVDILYWF